MKILGAIVDAFDAVNKKYVDDSVGAKGNATLTNAPMGVSSHFTNDVAQEELVIGNATDSTSILIRANTTQGLKWTQNLLPTKNAMDTAIAGAVNGLANPSESIVIDANGRLTVGGRLGQYTNGGVFYPPNIEPSGVGTSSFLMTDGAKGIKLSTRSFAIMAGANITCKSAAAGSTQYRVKNTYANRFACYAVQGGRAALNQADAANGTAQITSIKFANGNNISVHFGPEETSNDIIITLDKTVNPSAATTTIRCYGTNSQSDNILIGQGVGANGGKAISLGQSTYAAGNQAVAIGNAVHAMGNNSAGFGHSMLINKQYCFGAGQGHDFTNGVNGTSAFGTWSQIGNKTKFAVGNGTSFDARSNIFEIQDNAGATEVIMKSPNGTKFKLMIDDSGNLSTAAV